MDDPKFRRARDPATRPGPQWRNEPDLPLHLRPSSPEGLRYEFANRVVRFLTAPDSRVAVISEHGRPALVSVREPLYELLAKDHPIVGVYTLGARVKDVVDDMKAAGL